MVARLIDTQHLTAPRTTRLRDRCGLLKNYWYAAVRSCDLGTRKPRGCTILEERIVLFRDAKGSAVAMRDRCLHRNAPLSEGDVTDGCIGCPYHGWTYDSQGRCVNVPSEGPEGSPPEGLAIETFPVREQDGLVWVWMGGDHAIDRAPFRFPHWNTPGWGRYYMVTRFENNVTSLVENFMDVPHTVWVHKGWFRNRSRKPVTMTVERTAQSVLVTYDQPNDSVGFSGRILNPRGLPMSHTDKFYMPNVTRCDYIFGEENTGFIITSTCTPTSACASEVFTLISYKLGPFTRLGRFLLPYYTRQVIQQDVDIMSIHGRNLEHYGGGEYNSTPADTLHVYIESLREHAEAGGRGPAPQPATDEVTFWI